MPPVESKYYPDCFAIVWYFAQILFVSLFSLPLDTGNVPRAKSEEKCSRQFVFGRE